MASPATGFSLRPAESEARPAAVDDARTERSGRGLIIALLVVLGTVAVIGMLLGAIGIGTIFAGPIGGHPVYDPLGIWGAWALLLGSALLAMAVYYGVIWLTD